MAIERPAPARGGGAGDRASAETLVAFRRRLLGYYDARARALPWRETADPYAIWVSEVMAQQTRVETVVPYYRRWMERYPTVAVLAEAPLDDVLKSWEGLGYYSRARNLHRAAGVVVDEMGGRIPDTFDGLRALPGIGDYTAGAIASIAFDRAVPAVDGNVRRVHARLLDEPAPSATDVTRWAARAIDPTRPGDFNQALMELGARVCTPRSPACGACPVAGHCGALAAGTVDERPAPKTRTTVRREVRAVGVFMHAGPRGVRVLLRRRPDRGLLAGLWEFPSVAVPAGASTEAVAEAVTLLARELELAVADPPALAVSAAPARRLGEMPAVRHEFSHLHVTYRPWIVALAEGGIGAPGAGAPGAGAPGLGRAADHRWVDPSDPGELALPVAQQRIAVLACASLRVPGV